MNAKVTLYILVAVLLVGCESYREGVRGVGSSLGAIQIRDIRQANAYQKVLPDYLGLPPQQVRVEPGSGITHVTIYKTIDDAERQRIATALETLNKQNPHLNPLKWRF